MTKFDPAVDEGQAGWVRLPDGRTGYRYPDADELIIPDSNDE